MPKIKVKVDPNAKNQGHRSNGSDVGVSADEQTDRHYQVHYLPASLSYSVHKYLSKFEQTDHHNGVIMINGHDYSLIIVDFF